MHHVQAVRKQGRHVRPWALFLTPLHHAGQMGSGIAQVAAVAGLSVALCDSSALAIQSSAENLTASLENLVAQNKISFESAEAAALRIVRSTDIQVRANDVLLQCSQSIATQQAMSLRIITQALCICSCSAATPDAITSTSQKAKHAPLRRRWQMQTSSWKLSKRMRT